MRSQEVAKISSELLENLILREFPNDVILVASKLNRIQSNGEGARRRIAAAILKLADRDISRLDSLIEKANFDFRDIISIAEYKRGSNYSTWLKKD